MTDYDGTRLGERLGFTPMNTLVTGTYQVMVALQDVLERLQDNYRDKDLRPIKEFILGDPPAGGLTKFPSVAIVPEQGERIKADCDQGADGVDLIVLRLYHERAEKTGSDNATADVVRYLDFLRVLLYENLSLKDLDGRRRVYEAWPGRWVVGTFIEEDRAARGKQSRIRGGVLELDVRLLRDRIAQEGR